MAETCIVIPTYNNSATVGKVISSALIHCPDVFVVSDGADEETEREIRRFSDKIRLISYHPNRGKGYALKRAFIAARAEGFDYAITMDSDGQHSADDLPSMFKMIETGKEAIYTGSRALNAENMPAGNTFANRFSNFWFFVQTFQRLPDTQTGYRAYPLKRTPLPLTSRYEAELEILVRSLWRGVKVVPVRIDVYYAPKGERVTHFRRGKDFARISLLNTLLTLAAPVYGWPSLLFHKLTGRS